MDVKVQDDLYLVRFSCTLYSEYALSLKPSTCVFLLVFLTFADAVLKLFQAKFAQFDTLLDDNHEVHKLKIK